jgi:hypothetical protein
MASPSNNLDSNTENRIRSSDNTINTNLSSQISRYSANDRNEAYAVMQPIGGEQYLPQVDISDLTASGAPGSQNAAGFDNVGTTGSPTATSSDNVGTPGALSANPENVGQPSDVTAPGSDVGSGTSTGTNAQTTDTAGSAATPESIGNQAQTFDLPQPPPGGYNTTEYNEVNNAAQQIDNAVQQGHINTGLNDLNQVVAQWQKQDPTDANSMESQLMTELNRNYTSDGMTGAEVMEELGTAALTKSFDQYSGGSNQVSYQGLMSLSENDYQSNPVTAGLASGAAQDIGLNEPGNYSYNNGQTYINPQNSTPVSQDFFSGQLAEEREFDQYQYQNPQPIPLLR